VWPPATSGRASMSLFELLAYLQTLSTTGPLTAIPKHIFDTQYSISWEWNQLLTTVISHLPRMAQLAHYQTHPSFGFVGEPISTVAAAGTTEATSLSSSSCTCCRYIEMNYDNKVGHPNKTTSDPLYDITALTLYSGQLCHIFAGHPRSAYSHKVQKSSSSTSSSTVPTPDIPILPLHMSIWPLIIQYSWPSFDVRVSFAVQKHI
jgi:hypothetical protein